MVMEFTNGRMGMSIKGTSRKGIDMVTGYGNVFRRMKNMKENINMTRRMDLGCINGGTGTTTKVSSGTTFGTGKGSSYSMRGKSITGCGKTGDSARIRKSRTKEGTSGLVGITRSKTTLRRSSRGRTRRSSKATIRGGLAATRVVRSR